tara:strand:- start:1149 stop:1832 length:684 start_codon:yes stop_codon:yes gene_type:complete
MSGVATAIGVSAVVGYAGAKMSSDAQAKGAKSGAQAEERMSEANLEFQREMEASQREDFAPWTEAGGQALEKLWAGVQSGEFEVGNIDVKKDPGYQFRMDEGIEARDKSASARGRLLSGAQNKAIEEFAQGTASQEYGAAYAREANEKKDKYNMLAGISQQGQASAARQAGATSQLAQTGGNIMSNSGRSQNIAQQNIGDSRAGAYQGQATAVNQAAQNWMMYKALG